MSAKRSLFMWIVAGIAVVLACLGGLAGWLWFHNPLFTDQEMIAHLNQHRPELEQLVQGYRNFRPPRDGSGTNFYPDSAPWILPMMEKAGVYYGLGEAQTASGSWYPDPYSPHTLQTLRSWDKSIPVGKPWNDKESVAILQREIPALFEGGAPLRDYLDLGRVTNVIHIERGVTPKRAYYELSLRYPGTLLSKGYYYFPRPPRIEAGKIVRYDRRSPTGLSPGQRVFDSLDEYPPDWKRGECVLKRLDAHWFISMCRSY